MGIANLDREVRGTHDYNICGPIASASFGFVDCMLSLLIAVIALVSALRIKNHLVAAS